MSSRSSSGSEERRNNPPRGWSPGVTPRLTSLAAVAPPVGIAPLLAAIPSLVDDLTAGSPANPEVGLGGEGGPLCSEEGDVEDEVELGERPVFNPARKIHFPRDFLRYATEAAGFLQKSMPASVPSLNADLVVGDADDEGDSMDRRYPAATSFPQAFQRPFRRAFRSSVATSALNAVEATKVPEFHGLITNGTPLPDRDLLAHLTGKVITQKQDLKGKVIQPRFDSSEFPIHEHARQFADLALRLAAQTAALTSSASLLVAAVERMSKWAATPLLESDGGATAAAPGLGAAECEEVFELARLANTSLLAAGQSAGHLVASSVVQQRRLWMSLVRLPARSSSTLSKDEIIEEDVRMESLFGPSLGLSLARQEEFLDRKPAFNQVLPKLPRPVARGGASTSQADRQQPATSRDQSPPRRWGEGPRTRGGGYKRGGRPQYAFRSDPRGPGRGAGREDRHGDRQGQGHDRQERGGHAPFQSGKARGRGSGFNSKRK